MPDAQARDIVERLEGRDVLGNPTAPGAWFAAARAETRHWRIPGLSEADDPHYGYPLIDALSNPGKNATVKEGIERAEELADDVTLAIWNVAKSEIDRLTKERARVIEECAMVADNYGREGDRLSKEYACEMADELAARIRALAQQDTGGADHG